MPKTSSYLTGLKESAKACAFGTPTPVTLSQPGFVCSADALLHGVKKPVASQSVPKEMTRAVSCVAGKSHNALTNFLDTLPPSTALAV
jgi:hypothetical protein